MDVRFYTSPGGKSPVEAYLQGLQAKERARLLEALTDLRVQGFNGGVVTRQIDGKLWEIKVSQHRVFYVTLVGQTLVLLHAYKKQSQKVPLKEIAVAKVRMKEVLDG